MIKLKDQELTNIWMELLTKVNEKTTNKKVKVTKHGQMVLSSRANTSKERNTESVDSHGRMAQLITENSSKTTSKEKENTTGPTVENSMVSG